MDVAIRWKSVERNHFNFRSWQNLDEDYIKEEWNFRNDGKILESVTGLLGAFTWFILCIPIVEASWFMSNGGKNRTGPHTFLMVFAIGSSFTELIARLMMVGCANAAEWIAKSFALDSWNGGWKTLEITYIILRGAIIWIDAFESFALFVILILLFLTVWAEHTEGKGAHSFGKKWAGLGLVISFFCLFEFVADIMRFMNWHWYMRVSIVISIFNSVIALPIWLLILSAQLPSVRYHFERSKAEQESSSNVQNASDEINGIKEGGPQPPIGAFSKETNIVSDISSGGELS